MWLNFVLLLQVNEILQNAISSLKALRCPICTNVLRPPIRTCTANHTFCPNCNICTTRCGKTSSSRTNEALEQMFLVLKVPCIYELDGCDHVERGATITDHEAECKYKPFPCPLEVDFDCPWVGNMCEIDEHLSVDHRSHVFGSGKQFWRNVDGWFYLRDQEDASKLRASFNQQCSCWCVWILGRLFRIVVEVDEYEFCICAHLIKDFSDDEETKFSCDFAILDKNLEEKRAMSIVCEELKEHSKNQMVNGVRCGVTEYLNNDECLFSVEIIKSLDV